MVFNKDMSDILFILFEYISFLFLIGGIIKLEMMIL